MGWEADELPALRLPEIRGSEVTLRLDNNELRYLHRLVEKNKRKTEANRARLKRQLGDKFVDHPERMNFQRHMLTKIERMLEGE